MNSPLLQLDGIEKRFEGARALQGVSLEIAEGEVHALMGENGAGKSTLAKIVAGVVQPDGGEIIFRGKAVRIRNPLDAQRLGIGIVFQELDLFPHLSVAENIVIGNFRVNERAFVSFSRLRDFCAPFLARVGLDISPATPLCELPIGQMQLVAIARALSMDAKLILMDEPTSALGEQETERLFQLVRELTRRGVSMVYVSHKMHEIFRISDRLTVLRDGQYVGTRVAGQTSIREIISMMVGRDLAESGRSASHRTSRCILKVTGLATQKLKDITFDLNAGEVLGVAGLVGSGRSELGAALFGLDPIEQGRIEVNGALCAPGNARAAICGGIGLLPEDRKLQGLMMHMSVMENCTISTLARCAPRGVLRPRAEKRKAAAALTQTRTRAVSLNTPISALSGGNQQKVLLSRWLEVDPDVMFLDDPTRGIDVAAKQDIYQLIENLAARGKGIIMVSSELPELIRCCDRIIVLHDGEQMGCVDAAAATQEQIMALATRSLHAA